MGAIGKLLPKALFPVDGAPIVVRAVHQLISVFGCEEIFLLGNDSISIVEAVLKERFDIKISTLRDEPDTFGTAIAVQKALTRLGVHDFAYSHANIVIARSRLCGLRSRVSGLDKFTSMFAVSSLPIAPTHPVIDKQFLSSKQTGDDVPMPLLYSVGFCLIREEIDAPAKPGEPFETWVQRSVKPSAKVEFYDVEGDWSHLEDMQFYDGWLGGIADS